MTKAKRPVWYLTVFEEDGKLIHIGAPFRTVRLVKYMAPRFKEHYRNNVVGYSTVWPDISGGMRDIIISFTRYKLKEKK